jgi:hypothetical protein
MANEHRREEDTGLVGSYLFGGEEMKHINKGVCANNAALRILGRALLFGFMSAVPAVPIFCVPAHAGEDGPVVSTTEGLVRGFEKNGVNIFLGNHTRRRQSATCAGVRRHQSVSGRARWTRRRTPTPVHR